MTETVSRFRYTEPPGNLGNLIPTKAVFLDVTIDVNGNRFEIGYENDRIGAQALTAADRVAEFKTLLVDFAAGGNPGSWGNIQRAGAGHKSLLSLQFDELTFVAFRLSSRKNNWRFCHTDDPLTIMAGFGARAPFDFMKVGLEARRVLPDGSIIASNIDTNARGTDSTVAYFVINGTCLTDKLDGERIPFNLHLEFVANDGKFVPIIVDPDVGYPDGGYPP